MRWVQVIVGELFKGQAGECLRRTIVGRTHIAVETLVVEPYQFVTDGNRLAVEPSVELVSDFLYLGCHLLHGFFIRYFHPFTVSHHLLLDFGNGVMQGVGEQLVASVAVASVKVVCRRGITVQGYYIGVVHFKVHHIGLDIKQVSGKVGIDFGRNPPLAHIEIQLLVGYQFGRDIFQRLYRALRPCPCLSCKVVDMAAENLAFLHHVTCQDTPFLFPCACFGVVEHFALQRFYDLALAAACRSRKVIHVHLSVIVQAACQRLHRGQADGRIYLLESHRLTHDVGFHHLTVHLHFDGVHLQAHAVKRHQLLVAVRVEIAPLGNKRIVSLVQPFTEQGLLLPRFRFSCGKFKVSLTDSEIVFGSFHVRTARFNG